MPQAAAGDVQSAALQSPAVQRHREAEREVDQRREEIGLDAVSAPRRILQRHLDRLQQVEQADDDDQRGVLEEADDGVDQRRHRDAQCLRQDHRAGLLPVSQAHSIRRFILLLWNRLQSAAHYLRQVGGGEEDQRDLRAQQLVDRHAGGQEQRQHDRSHEQDRDQRHAADQLDEADAQRLDHRHARATAEREQDRERKGKRDAEGAQQQGEYQPAPARVLDVRQPDHSAPHQDADDGKPGEPQQGEPPSPENPPGTKSPKQNQKDAGERGAPVLLVGIGAEEDEAVLLGDEAPAGALGGAAGLRVGLPHRVEPHPVDEPPCQKGNDHPKDGGQEPVHLRRALYRFMNAVIDSPPLKLKPSRTGALPGSGKKIPRLERNTPGSGCSACGGGGSVSVIRAYQKNSCTSSGTLRMNSTYARLTAFNNRFADTRNNPTAPPSTVASTMPASDTLKVFASPTTSAFR